MSSRVTKIDKPPMLPPKKIAPDPDYEVIEFSNEQYSNAQPIKTTNGKSLEGIKCDLCGSMSAKLKCDQCNQQLFCSSCDDMFHRHPKRNTHIRKAIVMQPEIKPPLPPKGDHLLPVPPPRRKKTGMTPLLPRKDYTLPQRPAAPPSPALSLRERVSSFKRLIVPGNKSTPETPNKKEVQQITNSRPGTPNSDSSAKLPSLAMERIKIHTNNARDRMEIMQKRYHEYKDSINTGGNSESNRASMNASPFERINIDNRNSTNRSNSFGARFRSGSLSNFQSHFKNGNARINQNFNDFDDITTQDEGTLSDSRSRAFSSSVQDINNGRNNTNWQMPPQQFAHPLPPFGYMPNQPFQYHNHTQQAPCMNCSQQQLWNSHGPEPQWNAKNLNGSNMSLNLPQFYPQQFDMNGTTWMNNSSYRNPYAFGVIPNAYQFPVSRPHSRVPSRAASPALSSKSRKSSVSARNVSYRHSYMEQRLTDDESSESMASYMDDLDIRRKGDRRDSAGRSIRSSRQSSKSSPQRSFDEESETFSRRAYRQNARERRASSSARSITSRTDRRPSHVRSDSTQDSETELGTRALVQAKIREKVAQASSMDESSSDLWKPKATPPTKVEKPLHPTSIPKTTTAKATEKIQKTTSKPLDRKKSVERVVKPKISTEVQTTRPVIEKSAPKSKIEPPASEQETNEIDLNSVPDTASDGPPKTPDYAWTCEYCTFGNEANVKICAICCKTPLSTAQRKPISPEKEKKPPINGRINDNADISKEGFWMVSTSEDEISELRSYDSNESVLDSEEEDRSDNDLEVMEILGHTEIQQTNQLNAQPEVVAIADFNAVFNGLEKKDNEQIPSSNDGVPIHDDKQTLPQNTANTNEIHTENLRQISEQIVVQEASVNEQPPSMHSIQGPSEESHPIQSANQNLNHNQRMSLDGDILAYIDQSLKTLIDTNLNNNAINNNTHLNHMIQPTPFLPMGPTHPNQSTIQIQNNASNNPNRKSANDVDLYKVLLGANNYSFDEIQVALANSPDGDPLIWLDENWTKLIETVQTLATKYGQEHKENIVGTISAVEARDVLIKNKGSVWHAVTQCIEQRQKAFDTIKSQGNYSREDIVSTLTAHNGNVELAIAELNRLQMKPFLLKIQNSPHATENGLTNDVQPSTSTEHQTNQVQESNSKTADEKNAVDGNDDKNDILRDIEAIIGSMEEKQSKQTETLLSTIESLVGNMILSHTSRSISSASSFSGLDQSDNLDRIHVKSPIVIPSKAANEFDLNADVETDVKNFVTRHIQDVVPDVAARISKELTETLSEITPVEQVEMLFEEEIRGSETSVVEDVAPSVASEPVLYNQTVSEYQTQPIETNESTLIPHVEQIAITLIPHAEQIDSQVEPQTPIETPKILPHDSEQNELVRTENASDNIYAQASTSVERSLISPPRMDSITQQPRLNKPRFVVSKTSARFSQKQMDKRRIRELEKQIKRQQKDQRRNSMNAERFDLRNTEYLSDSTVIADELPQNIDSIPTISNEETFSLSIVEQAAHVDDNKEHNRTVSPVSLQSPDLINQPTTSSNQQDELQNESPIENPEMNVTVKNLKNRNLSELVEHTKSLIQQMKNEIDEDIAMSASEFGEDDNDGYLSDEIYSDEMGDEEGEFSDSWEDISDEVSIIGDESEYEEYEEYEYNAEFQRSSQSGESEFFVEARENVTSENEFVNDGDDMENREILENIDVNEKIFSQEIGISNEIVENQVENNVQEEKDGNENSVIESDLIEQQTTVNNTNNDETIDEMEPANQIVIEIQSNETTMSPLPPADNNMMLEIQQSLHTSSIVSVNFRETALREKSESVEPSDSQHSSVVPTPDLGEISEQSTDEYTFVDGPENASREYEQEQVTQQSSEELNNLVNETVESTEGIQQENNSQITDEPSVSAITNIIEEITVQPIGQEENAHETNVGTLTVVEPEVSENESQKDEESQSQSQSRSISISEHPHTHSFDTESEIEELSVDVSTSDSTTSKDNMSVKSSVSAASEKLVESYQYKKITVPVVTQCSSSSINVMQLKKTTPSDKHVAVKNKIPVRRPSFSEPSASIRNIQNELFNKQLKQPPKMVSKKPSKIVPPKVFFKSNIAPEASTSKPGPSKPSTSYDKLSIPKKKYYETCFSDDNYQTSDDENPITSMKVIPNLVKIVESNIEECDVGVLAQKLLDEGKVHVRAEALLAAELIQQKFNEDISIWAASECSTIEQATRLLQQECELCMETYPMNEIVFMLKCTHSCCQECAKNYFTIQITDRSITDCSCPFCKLPDLNASDMTEDDTLEYFSNMDILLKNIIEFDVHELFQRKLRDRTLMQDPNFKWCVQCSSGFFARPRQKRLICPDCGNVTCTQCRKTWEVQHEGITCDQYAEWKDLNDPDKQMEGVSKHLQLHGISCPKCKFKYSLARGGCMHFTCTQCKYEFCYGCNKPFKMGAKCGLSDYCAKLGLHSHHPRNCLFYLRDKEPKELQTLLQLHSIPFSTAPVTVQGISPEDQNTIRKYCSIPIQKETPSGLVDTVCNGDIEENSGGLCRLHFVEYLVSVVVRAKIDPLPILDLTDCVQELRRRGLALPERGPWDTDPIYRDMCSKIVEKHIPLD